MHKKTALAAFAAGAAVGAALSHLKFKVTLPKKRKLAPGPDAPVVPAPTASQNVPRPGRPRPQMRQAGSQHPTKHFR
ncbi:hypothetical protein [Lacticaseibacillus zhaodongensis]|uniref:hypothetical protein n=1 Tax=Lacticaseibacillus zhaodongensis TaxID=2668065 RepID=UPI0012D2DE97|nr:hypothetical protein [Lacticaseibacillus zhaodongensis]